LLYSSLPFNVPTTKFLPDGQQVSFKQQLFTVTFTIRSKGSLNNVELILGSHFSFIGRGLFGDDLCPAWMR